MAISIPHTPNLAALVVLLPLFSGASAYAEDSGRWRINGYGTLGFNVDNSPTTAFVRDLNQRPKDSLPDDGAWFSNDAWLRDSRLGLQIGYQFTPTLSAMTQLVWRDQITTTFSHYVDWAYLAYKPKPEADIRLGRLGYDVFLMSEQRHLGYGYPWARPPVEFYGWIPLYAVDGVDLAYTLAGNPERWRFKTQIGRSIGIGIPMDEEVYSLESDRLLTATLTRESGPWLIKAGYSHLNIRTEAKPLAPLHPALDAVGELGLPGVSAEAANYRRNMRFKDAEMAFRTLGISYDDKEWLVQAEAGTVTSSIEMNVNNDMAYAGLSRRLGDWTPYLMVGAIRPHVDVYTAAANWGEGLPPEVAEGLNGLQSAAITALNSSRIHQETLTLGLRWDFDSRAAVKWQWDTTHIHPNSYLLRPGFFIDRSQDMTVQSFTVNLDFMF
ncbi:MAG: hypothetical protein HQL56_01350 [Magnetococcales bacterium]|nr:hypothetical protein [Magnetococcales bacterium]